MSFGAIVGHDRAVSFLQNAAARGRVAQAYLFSGPAGIGKCAVARAFAQALQCAAPAGGRPCGACPSCRKVDALSHPDVRVVGIPRDRATIGIDEVRDLIRAAGMKPYEGRYAVSIVDGAGALTHEAQGALLKTLEEPSPAAVLILIAEKPERLLSTIVSRSQVLPFFPLAGSDVRELLASGHGVDPSRAHILAGISSGSPGAALRYLRDERFFERRREIIDGLIDRTWFDREEAKPSRGDRLEELDIILSWFRDILVSRTASGGKPGFINIDRREALAREAKAFTGEHLDRILRQVHETGRALAAHANPKLAMGVLGMEISKK